jgi:hypothetical protein
MAKKQRSPEAKKKADERKKKIKKVAKEIANQLSVIVAYARGPAY